MTLLTRIILGVLVLATIVAGQQGGSGSEAGNAEEGTGQKSVPLRTHSLYPPYLDLDLQSRWWEFGGTTVVDTNKQVRLTYDRPSQAGWIFSRLPLTATNFEIVFEFKIHGKGTGVFGDGLAMWITKQRAQSGTVFGFIDNFEGLGIFFDTYKNGRAGTTFPYVMAMLGDGQTPYDNQNDGKANDIGGCSARGLRKASVPTKGRLIYHKDNYLSLDLMYKKDEEWESCFKIPNVTLPTVAYLGFSAHTGEVSDYHDIIRVETKTIYTSTNQQRRPNPPKIQNAREGQANRRERVGRQPKAPSALSGFFMSTVRVMGTLILLGVLYFIWTAYRAQRADRF